MQFNELLSSYSIEQEYKELFKIQLSQIFESMNSESKSLLTTLKSRASALKNQITTMEDNWAVETDHKKKEILWKKITESEQNLIEIQKEISLHNDNSLNLPLPI